MPPQQNDEFAQYARPATAAPKTDEFAQYARSTPTEQKVAPGTFQTMKGGPVQNVADIGSKPLTYSTPGAAVSGAMGRAALPGFPQQIQESKGAARGMLPEIGSTIGMAGGLPGTALGAAVGKAMQPVMEGGKPDITGAAITGGATYVGGKALETALGAIPTGKFILNKIVNAKDARQVGDAMEAFMEAKPAGITSKMLMRDLDEAHTAASKLYGQALRNITQPVNVDALMNPINAEAAVRDAKVPGVEARVEKLIEAAKMKAGITGPTATAEELANFKNVVRKVAYRKTDDPIALATNDVMKMADHAAGAHIRAMSPEAAEALDSMSNMHAARSALKNYKPGKAASIAVSAALHPNAARIIAPPAAAAAAIGGRELMRKGEQVVSALP